MKDLIVDMSKKHIDPEKIYDKIVELRTALKPEMRALTGPIIGKATDFFDSIRKYIPIKGIGAKFDKAKKVEKIKLLPKSQQGEAFMDAAYRATNASNPIVDKVLKIK